MPDWSFPQLDIDDGDVSVVVPIDDDVAVDLSDVDRPDVVEDINYSVEQGVIVDVSGDSVSRVILSVEDFKSIVQGSAQDSSVSDNDPSFSDDDLALLAVDGDDISSSSFSPQAWQINMAEHRPIGWHYVMTRTGTNTNNYILVLGRNVTYNNGLYTYVDADFYSVYSTGSSGNTRYHYDVYDNWSGTISSSSYVVYSDLYFDYVGSRSVDYSWLILVFVVIIVLFLMFFRGNRL